MDYAIYRDIIPDEIWFGGQNPTEIVAGTICTAIGYSSGLIVAVQELGAGKFILNTLRIKENLGKDPGAERLLRNMLRYLDHDLTDPIVDLPANFVVQLQEIGL